MDDKTQDKNIDVRAVARLARLDLDDAQARRLETEMRQFDEFVACLGAICYENADTEKYISLEHCSREDERLPSEATPSELIALSVGAKDEYICVPITVGKEDGE